MSSPARGGFIIAIASCALLSGCFSPVGRVEAQQIAQARVTKFCRGRCGEVKFSSTQQIKDRWLVDFEAPRHKFTVTVEKDGNSKVDVWDKELGAR